jgi:glutathionyl-hydroquinone reductase
MPATSFSLGSESAGGEFSRQESRFREIVALGPGRYHLYVSYACPWAHRAIIARRLLGLEDMLPMSVVDPVRDESGWAFTGGEYVDRANGFRFLGEAYAASDPGYGGRFSVPVLWDLERSSIVNNESGDILRIVAGDHWYPQAQREEVDALNQHIYDTVNNAVYKAGFATEQDVYEREALGIFRTFDELDARLAGRRFLFGDEPVETDWRLFTTLVRFDAVYHVHFKCSLRRLVDYPNLWPYARDLYQLPGVADTVRFDEIRAHYYRTHPMVNPSGLVALMPAADWTEPHGRDGRRGGRFTLPAAPAR